MNIAGLIFDDSIHYLDHLAPFCSLVDCPLLICEERVFQLAQTFYPDVKIVKVDLWGLQLPKWVITCDNEPILRAAFPWQKGETIWLPHGNSDKGWEGPFFEGVGNVALVYGQKMIDFMHQKGVCPKTIRVGNFRWDYYLKHRSFYETQAPQIHGFLYAPTWEDSENNGSFWKAFPDLAESVKGNLFIKLHPNTLRRFEPELEVLMGRYARQKNLLFLSPFPPIYPLLAQCEGYIGDMSSIGYDFLKFDRPLFFLNAKGDLPLYQCGKKIDPKKWAFDAQADLSSKRKEMYEYTFDPSPNWKEIRDALRRL